MRFGTYAIATVTLAAMIVQRGGAHALGPDRNMYAPVYPSTLVQALDECPLTMTNVGGAEASSPSNSNTGGTRFTRGWVVIRAKSTWNQVATGLCSNSATPLDALANTFKEVLSVQVIDEASGEPIVVPGIRRKPPS
jgi:hypothetical protein